MHQSNESPLDVVHNAYCRFTLDELVLFLKVRNLPTSGTFTDLASRLTRHDFHTYQFPKTVTPNGTQSPCHDIQIKPRSWSGMTPDLPVELIADIMDMLGDWELSKAVGVPTSINPPADWAHASQADQAMITGYLPLIRAADPRAHPPTKLGALIVLRFGYVNVLEFLFTQHRAIFLSLFRDDLIPIKASRHGRTAILSWWKQVFEHHPDVIPRPTGFTIAEAIHAASRGGRVNSLEWWVTSGLHLEYTEAALEYASARNQIAVLDWWKHQHQSTGLPLKIGRVMDMASTVGHVKVLEWWAASQLQFNHDRYALYHASCHGKVDVLQWWLGSGLQLVFDQDALTGATRHNRPEVLEWWDHSLLPIQYRTCDIEEALEDAIGGGEAARGWWRRRGVDFNANDKEWMKLQNLNG
ncbi:hypothetical protein FIBSPDRAFT_853420 [Athelia psychrophila]|uniref:SAP domain-containing protein n=1 Tax=Athelia psychrophila TaxID=1759441 RepID=A0A166QUR1_9AGAM|nr:hypothetical protein FIBSPDRAFT_853420 [Fibularhizoctonia sp. CBS 109695]